MGPLTRRHSRACDETARRELLSIPSEPGVPVELRQSRVALMGALIADRRTPGRLLHNGSMPCVFCGIVAGVEPAHIVWDDTETMAFLAISPASPGHTLVVPKIHVEDIWAIEPDTFASVTQSVHAVSALIGERLRPDGLTLLQTNRPAGWQSVFHLHVHVVPRHVNDDLIQPWTEGHHDGAGLLAVGALLGARKQP